MPEGHLPVRILVMTAALAAAGFVAGAAAGRLFDDVPAIVAPRISPDGRVQS